MRPAPLSYGIRADLVAAPPRQQPVQPEYCVACRHWPEWEHALATFLGGAPGSPEGSDACDAVYSGYTFDAAEAGLLAAGGHGLEARCERGVREFRIGPSVGVRYRQPQHPESS
jgi:hypothetical protein